MSLRGDRGASVQYTCNLRRETFDLLNIPYYYYDDDYNKHGH